MRRRSTLLISIGLILLAVSIAGSLFPFVPILFSDAKFLSDRIDGMDYSGPADAMIEEVLTDGATSASVMTEAGSPSSTPVQKIAQKKNENVLTIDKIGVQVPLVEGKDAGALLYGAWRYPGTSRPNQGSNTVVFGHRFRYLPPNNTTFYNLDKLAIGDKFTARWNGKSYRYNVTETKIIQPNDFSVVQPTEKKIMTLITCAPLFSTKERLVVVGELVE